MSRRTAVLVVLAAAIVTPGAAGATDVYAQGHRDGGRCLFDGGLSIPAGFSAEIDDSCTVVVTPLDGPGELAPLASPGGADRMPKTMTGNPDDTLGTVSPENVPDVPGLGGTTVSRVAEEAGTLANQAVAAATGIAAAVAQDAGRIAAGGADTTDYRGYVGWTEIEVINELGQSMYYDYQEFTYRRRVRDGALTPPVSGRAECRANPDPVSAGNPVDYALQYALLGPYDADVRMCWTRLHGATTSEIAFSSGGWYETWLRAPYDAARTLYDARRMEAVFRTFDTGFDKRDTSCEVGELPDGWAKVICDAEEASAW